MSLEQSLPIRYRYILSRIEQEADEQRRLGHEIKTPQLCVVSKNQPSSSIRILYEAGVRDFGENRWDSLALRWQELPDIAADIRWHFIGHLQTRTIRRLAAVYPHYRVHCIHSAHDVETLQKLENALSPKGARQSVLLQVNVTKEASKQGLSPSQWLEQVEAVRAASALSIDGLMTMAPLKATSEELHTAFDELRLLRDQLKPQLSSCQLLSMGMSEDWKEALACGSDWIRIGRAVFDDSLPF